MTAAMVAGVVSPVAAAGKTFPDVPADHWGIDSINYLARKRVQLQVTTRNVRAWKRINSVQKKQLQ